MQRPSTHDRAVAQETWARLAPHLTGAEYVRTGRWRKHGRLEYYPEGLRLTSALPPTPTALHTYDRAGMAWSLPIDLDPGHDVGVGEDSQVDQDLARLLPLLESAGARVVVDRSRRGGAHVWVPLAGKGLRQSEAETLFQRIKWLCPSLDMGPVRQGGCLTGPGSITRDGSFRLLSTPLDRAADAVQRRSDPDFLRRLDALLPPVEEPTTEPDAFREQTTFDTGCMTGSGRRRSLSHEVRKIAETGRWPASRRRADGAPWTPSEARQCVITAAAGAGWSVNDVIVRIRRNEWAGMVQFYSRYGSPEKIKKAVISDWRRAVSYISSQPVVPSGPARGENASQRGMSQSALSGGRTGSDRAGVYRHLRRLWSVVERSAVTEWGRTVEGRTRWAVLRSLIVMGMRTGTSIVGVGSRSLAIGAACMDQRTVSRTLAAMRDEEDPWIRLVPKSDQGPDRYELLIPARYAHLHDAAEPLPTGRLNGVHAVFNTADGLGLTAWRVLTAVEDGNRLVPEIVASSGVSRTQAYEALRSLAGVNLVRDAARGWQRTRRTLSAAARDLSGSLRKSFGG